MNDKFGIVTATDSRYFRGTKILIKSLERLGFHDISVFDLGLTDKQREELGAISIDEVIPRIDRWQCWIKPFVIQQSPYRYNWRRKTMTFLQRKNAGTESELSVARRTKVPALGSWM